MFYRDEIEELNSYLKLNDGWDGENAIQPSFNGIFNAIKILKQINYYDDLEVSLHADGCILIHFRNIYMKLGTETYICIR